MQQTAARHQYYCAKMHLMVRVVFMGSPAFAVPSLRALFDNSEAHGGSFRIAGVVTQPDRPAGRGKQLRTPAVKTTALELELPLTQPENLRLPAALDQLRLWSPDLIVVAAFGKILRADVLALPPRGCINVHASLLPRWRGAAPIQAAILAGDSETGITLMKMDQGVDTGAILAQNRISIGPADTGGSLSEKLSRLGADLLVKVLPSYLSGELQPEPQDESRATRAPMLKKEDGLLNFALPASELERRVRAFDPWPGAYFIWNGNVLKVRKAHAETLEAENAAAGQRLIVHGLAAVGTGTGALVLDEVQPAGKKPMSSVAFLAGGRGWSS